METKPSTPLPPDPDPFYQTEPMILLERLKAVNLSNPDYQHDPDSNDLVRRVGDLPDAVLRIYALSQGVYHKLLQVGRSLAEEQAEWAGAAYEKTMRDVRDFLLRQIELCESFEDLEEDYEYLHGLTMLEFHKLFPELNTEDDLWFGVIGRTLHVIQEPLEWEQPDFVSFSPDSIKSLGLEMPPPELKE